LFLRVATLALGLLTALILATPGHAAAPENDAFSAAEELLAATGTYNGTNIDATKEAGEPEHAGNPGGASVWYRWTAPATGDASFDTFGSGFDSLLAVYTGSSVGGLTLVASNDDATSAKWTSAAGFPATAGTTYYIAVDGYTGGTGTPARGTFAVNWDLTATGLSVANDAFAAAVEIGGGDGTVAGSSFTATKESGEPNHAGNPGGASVWFRWTAPADARFTFTTEGSVFNTVLAVYNGISVGGLVQVVANDDIAWNNLRSSVTFSATMGTTYSIALDGAKASYSRTPSGSYMLAWQTVGPPDGAPANDWMSRAETLGAAVGSTTGTNVSAGKEAGEPSHAGNAGGASVWYSWTAPATGTATFSTVGSPFDTMLAIYGGSDPSALPLLGANDDVDPSKGPSEVRLAVTEGTKYLVAVDGYRPAGGSPARGDVVLSWTLSAGVTATNDAYADALFLGGTGGVVRRSSLGATEQTGEPDHAGNPGGASVWFKWRAPADGQWRFYTAGSAFNTLLAIYTGDQVSALTLVGANDDVSTTNKTSSVTFNAQNGTTYWITLDGYRGSAGPAAAGMYEFQWALLGPSPGLPVNDDFAGAWSVTGPAGPVTATNAAATKEVGEPDHGGNPGGASVWFKWTAPSSGPVYFDTPGSGFDTLLGVYTGTSLAGLTLVAASNDIAYNVWWPELAWNASYVSFTAVAGTTYYIAVDGRSAPGGAPARGSIFLDWWLSAQPAEAELLAAGDVASCTSMGDEATAALLARFPNAKVAALGDLAYPGGSPSDFGCYDSSWGTAKARTRPAAGDRDYAAAGATPYYSYWGNAAGAAGTGYYSYEIGAWHVVVLNSNCDQVGGCGVDSAQEQWLRRDLQAHVSSCTLAYMHHPLYASDATAPTSAVRPLWQALYDYGADLMLSGHARHYERFAPMRPDGTVDLARGIREFVVGTGGAELAAPGLRAANSEALIPSTAGILRLVLRDGGYDWGFLPAGANAYADAGIGTCDGRAGGRALVAPTAPGRPLPSAMVSATGNFSLSWAPSTDPDSSALTYTLERRAWSDAGFGTVADVAGRTSWSFASAPEREGTSYYRVGATDGVLASPYSPESVPVVVDKTRPHPISLLADRAPEYSLGGWFKDRVTVTPRANGDPLLADGSPGSGVVASSLSAPTGYSTSGIYNVTGSVLDRAGHRSLLASLTVKVDAAPPTITLTCPRDVKRKTTRFGRWSTAAVGTFTASDAESGLATPSSGTIVLDTGGGRGKATAYATATATDNVGHSTTATCTYYVK
jgi:hypothetical protein